MSNKLVPLVSEALQVNKESTSVEITGNVGSFYNQPGTVQNTVNVILPVARTGANPQVPHTFDKRRYNLFVIDGESFYPLQTGSFMLSDDLALTKCIDQRIKQEHSRLDEKAVGSIKSYLSIFANTNSVMGKPDDAQSVAVGVVQEIKRTNAGIRVDFVTWKEINQKTILDMKEMLGIKAAEFRNEFDDTHWTIKEANLIDVLRTAGIDAFSIV